MPEEAAPGCVSGTAFATVEIKQYPEERVFDTEHPCLAGNVFVLLIRWVKP
jgi:hypothetical protein